jgi:hypothetical protein
MKYAGIRQIEVKHTSAFRGEPRDDVRTAKETN